MREKATRGTESYTSERVIHVRQRAKHEREGYDCVRQRAEHEGEDYCMHGTES